MRGVASPESVAEHAWGVTLLALLLLDMVDEELDREKVLTTALIHDLPESVLSDIPSPVQPYFPPGAKSKAEGSVLRGLFASVPTGDRLVSWWREYEEETSPEGRLVKDADRLEMLLQAYLYETRRGAQLGEFWVGQAERPFHYSASKDLHAALRRRRDADLGR
jgi:putative hydrolase of HD superfamily